MGDEYIDDAFASMHRPHASIVGIPKILKGQNKKVRVGELVKFEMKNLDKSLERIEKEKSLVIISGAKISTKLPLILKFLKLDAKVFVAGGIASQIIKDILNYNIGLSYFEEDFILDKKDKKILLDNIVKGHLILPIDVLLQNNEEKNIKSIHTRDRIVDIGRQSIMTLKMEIKNAKNIIMNGPLGIYEEGFNVATKEILGFIKDISIKDKKVFITIGGGDTLIFTKKLKMSNSRNLFISTGGGAMLDYLLNSGDLPGIRAVL
jgi:phosphoglycerate kinase